MSEEKLTPTQIQPPTPETARPELKDTFRNVIDDIGGDLQIPPAPNPNAGEEI